MEARQGERQGESQKGAQRKVERAKSQQRRGVKKQSLQKTQIDEKIPCSGHSTKIQLDFCEKQFVLKLCNLWGSDRCTYVCVYRWMTEQVVELMGGWWNKTTIALLCSSFGSITNAHQDLENNANGHENEEARK